MKNDLQQKTYDDIVKLYDFAEDMINAIERSPSPDPETRLKLIEPVINQIEESTEILSEVFIRFVETGIKPDEQEKIQTENAIRKIFAAVNTYKEAVKEFKLKLNQ